MQLYVPVACLHILYDTRAKCTATLYDSYSGTPVTVDLLRSVRRTVYQNDAYYTLFLKPSNFCFLQLLQVKGDITRYGPL
jgi:hypothetical protein